MTLRAGDEEGQGGGEDDQTEHFEQHKGGSMVEEDGKRLGRMEGSDGGPTNEVENAQGKGQDNSNSDLDPYGRSHGLRLATGAERVKEQCRGVGG